MTRLSPPFTALISERVASGLVGSSGMARVSFRNGLTHQRWAMPWSMANTGGVSRMESAAAASRKLTWLSAMIAFGPALAMFSLPTTSMR